MAMQPPPLRTPMYDNLGDLTQPWAMWFSLVASLSGTQQNDLGFFNIVSYGATGRGTIDDTSAIKKAIADAEINGGTLFAPAGAYLVTDECLINYNPYTAGKGVSILGSGANCTSFIWGGSDSTSGGTPGTASASLLHIVGQSGSAQDAGSFAGFRILSDGGHTDRFANGLKVENRAYLSFDDLFISGMDNNLSLVGTLSSTFKKLVLTDGNYNVLTEDGDSSCNANTFVGCVNGGALYGGWNLHNGDYNIRGGTLENNGSAGGSGAYGLKLLTDSDNNGGGNVALNFTEVYVEGNGNGSVGKADLWINHTDPENMRFNIQRNKFRRLSAAFCKNMVLMQHDSGEVMGFDVSFNSFRSFGGYTPDAGRKYIDITSGGSYGRNISFAGNEYQDGVEVPDFTTLAKPVYQPSYFGGLAANQLTVPFRGALAYKTSNQSIPDSTATDVQWDAVDYDTEGFWDVGDPTKFTIPIGSGVRKIRVASNIEFDGGGTGYRLVNIRKNGGSFIGQPQEAAGVGTLATVAGRGTHGPVISVDEGDVFQVRVTQNSGGALDIVAGGAGGNPTWFFLEAVRGGNS